MSIDNEQFRAGFEAWVRSEAIQAGGARDSEKHVASLLARDIKGNYAIDWVYFQWEGYLEAKREASPLPAAQGEHLLKLEIEKLKRDLAEALKPIDAMPELPDYAMGFASTWGGSTGHYYTARQMTDYGAKCLAWGAKRAPGSVPGRELSRRQIESLALANGFKLKEQPGGGMALNPYVFDFADAVRAYSGGLRTPAPTAGEPSAEKDGAA